MAVSGYGIGLDIIRALGLPPETRSIDIHIGLEEAVEITCTFNYYPADKGLRDVLTILRRYHLIEQEGPPISPEHAAARARESELRGRMELRQRVRSRLNGEE